MLSRLNLDVFWKGIYQLSNLVGQVSGGRGKATERLAALAEPLERYFGCPHFPGSLNLILDRPIVLCPRRAVITGPGNRRFWPVSLYGVDILCYRYKGCPLHILEMVSSRNLRDAFSLRDGSSIEFHLPDSFIRKDALRLFFWRRVWGGHEIDYFSDAGYKDRTSKFHKWQRSLASQP